MVFDSFVYLFRFLPLILIMYYVAPGKMKNFVLILGSLIFYAWGQPISILFLFFLSVINYGLGLLIHLNQGKTASKIYLGATIVLNLGILFAVRYFENLMEFLNNFSGINLSYLISGVPLGIMIYVLRAISYAVDVYRKEVTVQKSFLSYFLYATLFLQYPAGTVIRYSQIQKDLTTRQINICEIEEGAVKFVEGLAKKVLLADNLHRLWETIAAVRFSEMSLFTAWLGIIVFAMGIYFEFVSISAMAEGMAKMFGFCTGEDFCYPYMAASVTDFWKKWYVSLGEWFRVYVYEIIAGKNGGFIRQAAGIAVAWSLIGIWLGKGAHYIFWGLWIAFFLILEKLFLRKVWNALPQGMGRLYTGFIVMFGWVIFALDNPMDVGTYFAALFGQNSGGIIDRQTLFLLTEHQILLVIAGIFCTPLFRKFKERLQKSNSGYGMSLYRFMEKASAIVLLILSLIYMAAF